MFLKDIIFQIDKTSKLSKLYSQREFDRMELDITVEQWILLKIIHEHTPIFQKELAEKSLRDPASITRTLDILERKGFIRREASAVNRRQHNIVLTKTGASFINKNLPLINRHRAKSLEGFSGEEVETLSRLLKKIRDNMK